MASGGEAVKTPGQEQARGTEASDAAARIPPGEEWKPFTDAGLAA